MDITRHLYESRPRLDDICLENVRPKNEDDISDIKGCIAEEMVRYWLTRTKGVEIEHSFPKYADSYVMEKNSPSILISHLNHENKRHNMADIDNFFFFEGEPYAVEVKSLKLNGVQGKLQDKLQYTQLFYDQQVNMLLFFPFYNNKRQHIEEIQKGFPKVTCIDSGYKKKQLNNAIKRYISNKYF